MVKVSGDNLNDKFLNESELEQMDLAELVELIQRDDSEWFNSVLSETLRQTLDISMNVSVPETIPEEGFFVLHVIIIASLHSPVY